MSATMIAAAAWNDIHPFVNACLNFTSFLLLVAGYFHIRAKRIQQHRAAMLGAASVSTVFLISYLIRFATSGAHRYPGDGLDKGIYLFILFSHMVLAVAVVPMVLRSLWLGLRGQIEPHRKIARLTFPIWLYVSLTGVVVYVMLYQLGPRLP